MVTSKILNWLVRILENHNRISVRDHHRIHHSARIKGATISGSVEIGEGCRLLGPGIRIKAGAQVTLGRFTSLNGPNMDIVSLLHPVSIGSFCSIARNVSIQEFNHRYDGLTTYHIHQNLFGEQRERDIYSNGPVEIGHDVWIGTQCVITSGSTIGNGAVVGANSVVVGEIPPFAIAAGSPAKVLKYRFSTEKIKEIEEMRWWDWPIDKLLKNRILFE